jgi:hypothetical protein
MLLDINKATKAKKQPVNTQGDITRPILRKKQPHVIWLIIKQAFFKVDPTNYT